MKLFFSLPLSILAYLVGAIPTGYLFCKKLFGIDITRYGSGNIGATNVARVLGRKRYFFLIFFLDFIKTVAMLFLAHALLKSLFVGSTSNHLLVIATCLLVGNAYSVFLDWKGGKGVSTTLGVLFFLFPYLFAGFLFVWLVFFISFRRVDLASLVAIVSVVPQYACFASIVPLTLLFLFFMVSFVLFRHKDNIKKLLGIL